MADKTYKFVCVVCGFEVEVDTPELPEDYVCPVCGVGRISSSSSRSSFELRGAIRSLVTSNSICSRDVFSEASFSLWEICRGNYKSAIGSFASSSSS